MALVGIKNHASNGFNGDAPYMVLLLCVNFCEEKKNRNSPATTKPNPRFEIFARKIGFLTEPHTLARGGLPGAKPIRSAYRIPLGASFVTFAPRKTPADRIRASAFAASGNTNRTPSKNQQPAALRAE